MESVYRQTTEISCGQCDRYNRIRPAAILSLMQDAASAHCCQLGLSREELSAHGLFWAISRQHVAVNRLPILGETVTVESWPGKTSRVAFPRSTVCYAADGTELFRSASAWVLMDEKTRALVVPGKSGLELPGHTRDGELPMPHSLAPMNLQAKSQRRVSFTDLDSNGHMNNCHCGDWMMDLLPSSFHESHPIEDFTVSYLTEAREGDVLDLSYRLSPEGVFRLDATNPTTGHRVFSLEAQFRS